MLKKDKDKKIVNDFLEIVLFIQQHVSEPTERDTWGGFPCHFQGHCDIFRMVDG